jgi:two-component system response regulator HydG
MSRALVVDDDPDMSVLLRHGLTSHGFECVMAQTGEEALDLLRTHEIDVVVSDIGLPSMDGVELCQRIVDNKPQLPVVMITAHGSINMAVSAMRAGAQDFILKPVVMPQLVNTLERVIASRQLREEVQRLRRELGGAPRAERIIGNSQGMQDIKRLIQRIAPTEATVLITGESGTGKELVAQAVHESSLRGERPFICVNCAAIPENLVESELFGHARGAFTDARSSRRGLIQEAEGGTLFLDEVGELPIAMQPKLLRALQERTIRPVGADQEVSVNVRLIAATNRDLLQAVERGQFRQDLYYRLNVVNVEVPPLRHRGNDVLLLAHHFMRHFALQVGKNVKGILASTAERLLAYEWPGNVRELQNCIERAVALAESDHITPEDTPSHIQRARRVQLPTGVMDSGELPSMAEIERRYILHVLKSVEGNKTAAARILGFDRKTIYRKLAEEA